MFTEKIQTNKKKTLWEYRNKAKFEGRHFAINEINKIVNNETLIGVLNAYPYNKNPWQQAILSYLMDKKRTVLIYYIIKVVNS